jgi:alpha-tubulin suppressor-like RCC1 family protein
MCYVLQGTGQLGHGDRRSRPVPTLVEGLEGVRGVAAALHQSLAVTHTGRVVDWEGRPKESKRVDALRGVRVSSVAVGFSHTLALSEDGLMYAWGENEDRLLLGNPDVERELLPKPVEALQSVRVVSVAANSSHSCAVAETGELYTWGFGPQLGQGMNNRCPLPTPVESLQSIKVVAVSTNQQTLALAKDGILYAWGNGFAAEWGALGLGAAVRRAREPVRTAQRVPELCVACAL